jgi:hypothetical protein
MTFDIYPHLIQKSRPHAAQAMDDLLFGKKTASAVAGKSFDWLFMTCYLVTKR